MNAFQTAAGVVFVLEKEAAFAQLAEAIKAVGSSTEAMGAVALSGGATPAAFYAWAVATGAVDAGTLQKIDWFVSDERCVMLDSADSNFGNAERQFLDPLRVPLARRHPWPVALPPADAATAFNKKFGQAGAGRKNIFDLCVLGLGDDAHTASFWPGCPLIGAAGTEAFAATEWPGRGWRLTVTEAGLAACGQIIVMAFGANKAHALDAVLWGADEPKKYPAQVLRALARKVTWLVDPAAAAKVLPKLVPLKA